MYLSNVWIIISMMVKGTDCLLLVSTWDRDVI